MSLDDDEFEEYLKFESVFKDETTLLKQYLPPKLPHRETQIQDLARNFRPLFIRAPNSVGGFACNIAVTGSAGVGKTATVRYTAEKLQKLAQKESIRLIVNYVNCWNNRTRNSILASIMRDSFGVSTRGLGTEETIDNLRRQLTLEDRYLILILDEVHILTTKDLKSFIHLTEWMADRISVIMITRTTEWNMVLDPEISQRVLEVLKFDPYTKDEMEKIFDFRVDLAFKEGAISDDIITMVAEIASQTRNTRHGIEILYLSGKLADKEGSSEVEAEQVRTVKNKVYPELRAEVLTDLNKHELYAALGIAKRLLNRNFTATTIKEAYRYYQMITEQWGESPNSESAFRNYLDTLARYGLIGMLSSKAKRGRGGSRLRVTIHDVPAKILAERIEERLENTNGEGEDSESGSDSVEEFLD
ncbi:MAG: Cdc6/Cdc18 family protein [Candidatus Hodarchaeales archaeon]|jgi:cell division control protein 6